MKSLPIRSPSVLTTGQRLLLAQASNGFDLAEECPGAACRRTGMCRGFEVGGSARCLVELVGVIATCARLARVLLPGSDGDEEEKRAPSLADEMREQMERMQRHTLALIKREIDQFEDEDAPAEERENKLV